MNKPPYIVIFDFDGVLLVPQTSQLLVQRALNAEWYEWNREFVKGLRPLDILQYFEDADAVSSIQFLKKIHKEFAEMLPSRFKRWMFFKAVGLGLKTHERDFSSFYPGVVEEIKRLHQKGVLIGICTSGTETRTIEWLKSVNLDKIIECIITRDAKRLYGLKPSPGPLFALLLKMIKHYNLKGFDRRKIFFVGDNVKDVKAAKNAFFRSVAVLSGFGTKEALKDAEPDYLLNSAADLSEIEDLN